MNMVHTCKKHGELGESDVTKERFKWEVKSGEVKEKYRYRCLYCRRDKDRKWKLNNPDKHKASSGRAKKESRRLYREGILNEEPKANVWAREDRMKNREKYLSQEKERRKREGQLRNTKEVCRRLKFDVNHYYEMLKSQEGKCAICRQYETRKSRTEGKTCALTIDHDHVTGQIRELLCHSCNVVVGHCRESIDLLNATISYLKKHKCD
jgi:Recombination endonuclease VII